MSFTFNMHLCMGELESVGFMNQAPTCEMHSKSCHGDMNADESENGKEDCCEDEKLVMQGQDELPKTNILQQTQPEMVAVLYLLVSFLTSTTDLAVNSTHKEYIPPLLRQDIPVSYSILSYIII
jgi:hypothetical protein